MLDSKSPDFPLPRQSAVSRLTGHFSCDSLQPRTVERTKLRISRIVAHAHEHSLSVSNFVLKN